MKWWSYLSVCLSLCWAKQTRGVQSFTIFLQVFSEDIAGLSPLGGVVQRDVSVDILQQNVHPGLPGEKAEETQTNWVLAGAINQTWTDDKLGPIILASQRRVPEKNHGDINRQYSELKNSLKSWLGGVGQWRGRALVTVTWDHCGEHVSAFDKINVCLLNKDPARAVFCYSMR